ncbi:MAG: hypothetical protein KAT15_01140, partial [Bacteroidales bacterium]|nr:hypothetical protein [Bacteroidales bacterium]
ITGPDGGMEVKLRVPVSGNDGQGPSLIVQTIFEDQSGRIWAGTSGGLALLDQAELVFTLFTFQEDNEFSLSNNDVQAILQDKEGTFWIGTNTGLNRFETQTNRFYRYFHDPGDEYSLVQNSVEDIILDPHDNLVIGTLGGISVLSIQDQQFYNYSFNTQIHTELNNEFVNCLYADEEGNIWIGTDRGGINQYNVHQNEFEYLVSSPEVEQSLSSNTINSVWEDEEALWVGTAGGGLNRIDKSSGKYRHYLYDASMPASISSDFITCIQRDHLGNLLIGTWGFGLNHLHPGNEEDGNFMHYLQDPGDDQSLVNNFVSSMAEDRFGMIWIGTYGGLVVYSPENQEFNRILQSAEGLIDKIGCLNFDLYSNLWIGTEEGLYFIPASTNEPLYLDFSRTTEYIHHVDLPGSLSGDYIISIFDDSFGNLWFGTYGNGLNKLPADSLNAGVLSFTHYSEDEGLCNNTIYGIQEDPSGSLWLSTEKGLSRFNINTERFTNYFMVDGLLHNQFYWSSSFKSSTGKLYFGSMNGLPSFFPEKIKEHVIEPGVILTDFKIYNQSVQV